MGNLVGPRSLTRAAAALRAGEQRPLPPPPGRVTGSTRSTRGCAPSSRAAGVTGSAPRGGLSASAGRSRGTGRRCTASRWRQGHHPGRRLADAGRLGRGGRHRRGPAGHRHADRRVDDPAAAYCGWSGSSRVTADGVIANAPAFDTVGFFTADVASAEFAAPCSATGGGQRPSRWACSWPAAPAPTRNSSAGPAPSRPLSRRSTDRAAALDADGPGLIPPLRVTGGAQRKPASQRRATSPARPGTRGPSEGRRWRLQRLAVK